MRNSCLIILLALTFYNVSGQSNKMVNDSLMWREINDQTYFARVQEQNCIAAILCLNSSLSGVKRNYNIFYPSGNFMVSGNAKGDYLVGTWVYYADDNKLIIAFKTFYKSDKVRIPNTISGFVDLILKK